LPDLLPSGFKQGACRLNDLTDLRLDSRLDTDSDNIGDQLAHYLIVFNLSDDPARFVFSP
jgi:hypothetical protein